MDQQATKKENRSLAVRYAGLQFGYWMNYLVIFSFGTVVMKARGFEPAEIGIVTTLGAVLTVVLQTTFASLVDKSEKIAIRDVLIAIAAGCIATGAAMTLLPGVRPVTFACMFLSLSLTSMMQPFMTSLCLQYNEEGHHVDFGVARSMGSLGYAASGFLMGIVTQSFGTDIILPIFCGLYVLILLLLISMPGIRKARTAQGTTASREEKSSSLIQFFRSYPRYDLFLVGVVLMFFMQMVLNTYMIYFVNALGGGEAEMGTALSVGAFLELPAVAISGWLLKRFRPQLMLRIAAAAGLVKFTAMLFITNCTWFIALHTTHFFYSGLYMVSSVYFADRIVRHSDAVKAQTLLAVGLSGIGGIAANLLGGALLEVATVRTVMLLGAVVSALGCVFIFTATRAKSFPGEAPETGLRHF